MTQLNVDVDGDKKPDFQVDFKTLIMAVGMVVSLTLSYAMLKTEIEGKIALLDAIKHETLINIALMLHEEGVKAHDSGDHAMSEELLNGALRLLDI